ncbi:hypothetical protein KQI38_07785 [Tissierella carlieri]|uniref:Uncharacterized protein n=1 Tax=Tissierella carlieri TaxID=689904 RepID=A0ABT1SDL5_9FIRM|nr:hypothetical protein [Tissierella carlieri]MBU5311928.1 hypothetical protein [Tissierella carlieri]MCQ4924581.1 hypothetical protein [Tissierella carlieri]MDU5083449.1 hypothetical protein [Bacillota bacterium]
MRVGQTNYIPKYIARPITSFWNKELNNDIKNVNSSVLKQDSYKKQNIDTNVNISVNINVNNITQKMYDNRKYLDFYEWTVSYEHCNSTFYVLEEIFPGYQVASERGIHLTEVSPYPDPKDTRILKVDNNKLLMEPNQYYKFKHKDGIERIYGASRNSFKDISFVDTIFWRQMSSVDKIKDDTIDIIHGLFSGTFYPNLSQEEISFILKDFGFKPGLIEIGIGNNSKKYLFMNNGQIQSIEYINSLIDVYNSRNHLEWGIPEGSKWIIGGNEYEMDKDGYFNLSKLDDTNLYNGEFKIINKDGEEMRMRAPESLKNNKDKN